MHGCSTPRLTPGERPRATALLRADFEDLVAVFAQAGFPGARRVRLGMETSDSRGRHFANCRGDGLEVMVEPRLALLPAEQRLGVLAHELGHAIDFQLPAMLRVRRGQIETIAPSPQDLGLWKGRGRDQVERDADRLAGAVVGTRIGYTGGCLLQTLGRGARRPPGLR